MKCLTIPDIDKRTLQLRIEDLEGTINHLRSIMELLENILARQDRRTARIEHVLNIDPDDQEFNDGKE